MSDQPTVLPLTEDRKDYLFTCLLRIPAVFVRAKGLLRPEDMDSPVDVPYLAIWQAALAVAERQPTSQLPPDDQARVQIELEAKELAIQDPETVTRDHFDCLFGPEHSPNTGLIDA